MLKAEETLDALADRTTNRNTERIASNMWAALCAKVIAVNFRQIQGMKDMAKEKEAYVERKLEKLKVLIG